MENVGFIEIAKAIDSCLLLEKLTIDLSNNGMDGSQI